MKLLYITSLITFFMTYLQINISVQAFISPGYHYNHFCQLSVKVTSDQLQKSLQLFNLISKQNLLFWDNNTSRNQYYLLGNDHRQDMVHPSTSYCLFPQTSMFYCILISSMYTLGNYTYGEAINDTFYSYTFRISKILCPQSRDSPPMIFMLQIPSSYAVYDYAGMVDSSVLSKMNLTFLYQQNITISTNNLNYLQTSSIIFSKPNYQIQCSQTFTIDITFNTPDFYRSWSSILIHIHNINILDIDLNSCTLSCSIEGSILTITNPNFEPIVNDYSYPLYQIFQNKTKLNLSFLFSFNSVGSTYIEVSIKSLVNSTFLPSKFITNNPSQRNQEYGYNKTQIFGYNPTQYSQLGLTNSAVCVATSSSYNNIFLLIGIVILTVILVGCRNKLFLWQKYAILIMVLLEPLINIIYAYLQTDISKSDFTKLTVIFAFILNIICLIHYFLEIIYSDNFRKIVTTKYPLNLVFLMLLMTFKSFTIVLVQINIKKSSKQKINKHIYVNHLVHLAIDNFKIFLIIFVHLTDLVEINSILGTLYTLWQVILFIFGNILAKVVYTKLQRYTLAQEIKNVRVENRQDPLT